MNEKTYIFIGDSITYGYGVKYNENWVYKLKETLPNKILNKGVNGNTTTDMLNRFSEDVIENHPSLVFIMGGTNDLLSNRSVSHVTKNIELMIKDCILAKVNVIIGIPPTIIISDAYKLFSQSFVYEYCKNQLPLLRDELIKLCNAYNISFVDFYTLSLDNLCNDIFNDGIHLNAFGQNLFYSNIIKTLNSCD